MSSLPLTSSELQALLQGGADSSWRDGAGNTLLHHAARFGDQKTVKTCLDLGVAAGVYNFDGECARDVARAWGHDAVAAVIETAMSRDRDLNALPPLSYASLQEIRDQSKAEGVNLFHQLAAQGRFAQVVALAEKTAESFTADDLLSAGADGDKVIFKICQQSQFGDLLKPRLWSDNLADLRVVLENVPKVYSKDHDITGFMNEARQTRLQSRAVKPQWKKGPK